MLYKYQIIIIIIIVITIIIMQFYSIIDPFHLRNKLYLIKNNIKVKTDIHNNIIKYCLKNLGAESNYNIEMHK